ncbi:hypothetical protein fHeYen902_262 [Yersinia phage fHe-Yen9-02]|nr:hypothetical protein fHeYen902_262 [Yersinia phage fHe-Yen9-02]
MSILSYPVDNKPTTKEDVSTFVLSSMNYAVLETYIQLRLARFQVDQLNFWDLVFAEEHGFSAFPSFKLPNNLARRHFAQPFGAPTYAEALRQYEAYFEYVHTSVCKFIDTFHDHILIIYKTRYGHGIRSQFGYWSKGERIDNQLLSIAHRLGLLTCFGFGGRPQYALSDQIERLFLSEPSDSRLTETIRYMLRTATYDHHTLNCILQYGINNGWILADAE